jgi:transcriptional regulator with XRE-family HTH domain
MKKTHILVQIAKRIKQLRKVKKISQEQLAEKANLHPTFIGNIERAETNPTITTLEKIAKAFSMSVGEFLTFPEDKTAVGSDADTLKKALRLLDLAKQLSKID